MSCLSLARSALMTGHSTYMYSSVFICVACQQSWLANSSWRLARSLTNVLLEFGSLCADDGSQHLHVFFGFHMCSLSTVVACTNSSWRLARSLTDVLFGDALHCSLMTDCGGYMYFSDCYHSFSAPY